MAARVLLRDRPHRSLAIVTPTHALILRHIVSSATTTSTLAAGQQGLGAGPKCLVELVSTDGADLDDYRVISPQGVTGTLGLITVAVSYTHLTLPTKRIV